MLIPLEYKRLAQSVDGTYIKLSVRSKEKINPFDFSNGSGQNLAEHIQDLTELISLITEGLTSEEKSIVDKALIKTYKQFNHSMKEDEVVKKKRRKKEEDRKKQKRIQHLRTFTEL